MSPARLNALTDGVVSVALTIMVLELKFPAEPTLHAALAVLPLLAAYLLAFVNVAIYWNNHHHMMQSAHRVTGSVLWTNHALL
ncbi:MAG TPA: TMEM175 family protein, partial [Sphingomicrobium sp.]|nr:TMEM175 family protein [Sphingomicrobium sp.]